MLLRKKNHLVVVSCLERESRVLERPRDIERISSGNIECNRVSMCVLNVLIHDQCANLCAKWNIYARQLDTNEQWDATGPKYLGKREQHFILVFHFLVNL